MTTIYVALAIILVTYAFRVGRSLINKDKEEFSRATILTATALPIIGLCYLVERFLL